MGISGLLPLLKSIHRPCNLKKFEGQTLGVDAYGWLHRGTAACAVDLALDKPTTKYVDFCMNRVRMLIHFGITPYLIFDGDNLPSKAGTEKERREKRKEGRRLGLELLKVGKTSQAQQELQKAVDVTPEMARAFIEELKHHNIQYIVAPYEADSQMAYLERKGIISGVLSEDSDLLVFGVKCLITKLDKYGDCVEVNRSHFAACREVSLVGWTDADFRRMAILSGCDYLPGIGGLGLKTAHRMLRKHKTVDRLVKAAQFDGKLKVPAGFMAAFDQAEKTFLYQWVFCPIENKLVNLNPLEDGLDISEMPFLGEEVPAQLAAGVARGDLYPRTKLPMTVNAKMRPMGKPLAPARRASAPLQTPDPKGHKPIDNFFKPKRTPLAELDPNSFTPSPSQQALLQQQRNQNGWRAVPAPSPFSQRTPAPRTAPQPPRRIVSESYGARLSAPHPTKRQRLCSDLANESPASGEGVVRSQFFASSIAQPSPSLRSNKIGRRKTTQDFELFSDDSLHEAMALAAELEESASQPKKKMRVFSDAMPPNDMNESQSTTISKSSAEQSQDTGGTLTPNSSLGSPEPESMFGATLKAQVKELRSKFTYQATPAIVTQTASSRTPRRRRTEAWASSARAVVESPDSNQEFKFTPNVPGTPATGNGVPALNGSARIAKEAEVVVAASPPVAATPQKRRRSSVRGSEDLLVPDSEAESESSPRKPMFNMARFAFTG